MTDTTICKQETSNEQPAPASAAEARRSECCEAMTYAIKEDYLYHPIQMIEEEIDGRKSIGIKAMPPAMHGPLLKPRGKKRKPPIILSICPFCGFIFEYDTPASQEPNSDIVLRT